MPTRNLKKNQKTQSKKLDKNESNLIKSITLDYKRTMDIVSGKLREAAEKYNGLTNESLSKFGRREKLFHSLNDTLNELFGITRRKIRRFTNLQYQQSYFRNSWCVDQRLGKELKWKLKK